MSGILPLDAPCAKGWVPYALEECSRLTNARRILEDLRHAIASLAPHYSDLTDVFDRHLLSHVVPSSHRAKVVRHLERHWFGDDRRDSFFPDQDVRAIYAQGVIAALDLALRGGGQSSAPITSWWIVDAPHVKMLTFADISGSGAAEGSVTLLIMTPRPHGKPDARQFILREEAEVWVSEQVQGRVSTRCLGEPRAAARSQEGARLPV